MFAISSNFARADLLSAIAYPIAAVTACTLIGEFAVRAHILSGWYIGPYTALAVACANRVCLRSGLICAALGIAVHSYVFVHPRWAWEMPPLEQVVSYIAMFVAVAIVARRTPRPTSLDDDLPPRGTRNLPFVKPDTKENGRYWSVPEPTGDWAADTRLGAEYARIYVQHWHELRPAPILPWVVEGMVVRGTWSGIEAGFLGVVGRAALRQVPVDPTRLVLVKRQLGILGPEDYAEKH